MNFFRWFLYVFSKKDRQSTNLYGIWRWPCLTSLCIKGVIMRINLIAFLITIACINVSANVHGQDISLQVRDVPIKKVFQAIEKQSGFTFWYDNRDIQQATTVTLILKNTALKDALDKCFAGQPLTYTIVDKTIFVKAKEKAIIDRIADYLKTMTVTGKVVDETGNPLPGATIKVKGTNLLVYANTEGRFSISNVPDKAILQISYIGYETKEILAADKLITSLVKTSSRLDDIQVVAYGTITRRLNTGSVSTVKAEDIERQPVSNPLAALQGRVPGLVISQTSGVAGSAFKVQIRGQSSMDLTLSKNNPLFVIDGVPFESGNATTNQLTSAVNNPTSIGDANFGFSPLNTINPQDIESIDVLKDADATSIYGSRGANGVILITTKKGKVGKTNVNLNINSGFSSLGRTMKMLKTEQYVALRKEAFANDGIVPSANATDLGFAPDITLWDTNRYTDFKQLLIGNTPYYNNIQASLSGGSGLTQFRLAGNFHRETSVYSGNYSDKVASFSANLNHTSTDGKFNASFSALFANDKNQLPRTDLTRFINLPPNMLLHNAQGGLNWDEAGVVYSLSNIPNPLAILNQTYQSVNENLSGNLNLKYNIIAGLTVKANLGYNAFTSNEVGTIPSTAIDPNLAVYGTLPSAEFATGSNKNWIIEPQLEYQRDFQFGKLTALLGSTFQERSGKSTRTSGNNYTSDLLLNSIAAAGSVIARNDAALYRYNALFGRISYNYHDKYLLNVTARRDGSSRFGPDKQFANFGSIGAAWIFSDEPIIKNALPFLSFGKIRSSYGTTGNDQIGDYKFLNLWGNTPYAYNGTAGLAPSSLFNPNYNWEVTKKLEVAIDLGFLNDRILATTAYYCNRSSNQLVRYVLPTQTGFGSIIKNFPGLVENSGFEVSMNSKNINTRSFSWNSSFNISIPKNKLVSFPGLNTSSYKTKYVEGQSLSIIRAFNYLGVDPQTGLYTFEDVDKDGLIYTADYQYWGNTDPKFTGGVQNNLKLGNFDLAFFFQFNKQVGLNYVAQLASSMPGTMINQPSIVLGRWQHPGDNAETQRLSSDAGGAATGAINGLAQSTGAYTDASYIKLKNISLGYSLPLLILKRVNLTSCRIYIDMQNVWTITNYKGADPEVQNFYILPPLRTVVAGIQLNL